MGLGRVTTPRSEMCIIICAIKRKDLALNWITKSQHISDLLLGSKHIYLTSLFRLCLCNTPMTLGMMTRQFHVLTWYRTIHCNDGELRLHGKGVITEKTTRLYETPRHLLLP